MLIHRVQVPPQSDAATRTARDVLEDRSDMSFRVALDPEDAATRSESSWRGLAAEVLEVTATRAFKCGFSASSHLLTAVDRGALTHGETRIGGVVASTRRDIGRTLSFIPKGYSFQGTFMPRILPRCGNLYIDPALSRGSSSTSPRCGVRRARSFVWSAKATTIASTPRRSRRPLRSSWSVSEGVAA